MYKKGHKHTKETKLKISNSHKGKKGKKHTEETKEKISKALKKFNVNPEERIKKSERIKEFYKNGGTTALNKHWKLSKETRKKQSIRQLGEKNFNWKGGVTAIHICIRELKEYQVWRKKVLKRDGYKCIKCKNIKELQADHIYPLSKLIKEIKSISKNNDIMEQVLKFNPLWDINNGRTLCFNCHKKTPTFAGRCNKL